VRRGMHDGKGKHQRLMNPSETMQNAALLKFRSGVWSVQKTPWQGRGLVFLSNMRSE